MKRVNLTDWIEHASERWSLDMQVLADATIRKPLVGFWTNVNSCPGEVYKINTSAFKSEWDEVRYAHMTPALLSDLKLTPTDPDNPNYDRLIVGVSSEDMLGLGLISSTRPYLLDPRIRTPEDYDRLYFGPPVAVAINGADTLRLKLIAKYLFKE